MANFARHILFDEPLRCDARSGLQSLELANAISLSCHLQQTVALPIDRSAYTALLKERCATSRPKLNVETRRVTDPTML